MPGLDGPALFQGRYSVRPFCSAYVVEALVPGKPADRGPDFSDLGTSDG